jgi:hypothetical protein
MRSSSISTLVETNGPILSLGACRNKVLNYRCQKVTVACLHPSVPLSEIRLVQLSSILGFVPMLELYQMDKRHEGRFEVVIREQEGINVEKWVNSNGGRAKMDTWSF